MNGSGLNSTVLGTAVAMGGSIVYLVIGPVGLFGIPDTPWAEIIFCPGIWTGLQTYELFGAPVLVCQAVGVVTMGIIGGVVGLAAGSIGWQSRQTDQ